MYRAIFYVRLRYGAVLLTALTVAGCSGWLGASSVEVSARRYPTELIAARATSGISADALNRILRHSPLPPPPKDATNRWGDSAEAARLGQKLFFDTRLSSNGKVSCATCHQPKKGLADGLQVAKGLRAGTRNTPSLWNVAYQRWYFWDGRADSLWSQALQPLTNPAEMNTTPLKVAQFVAENGDLRSDYERVFGRMPRHTASRAEAERVFVDVGKAIAAYERRLITGETPFDRYVAELRAGRTGHEVTEFSPSARRGLLLFVGKAGCSSCHSGPQFTDGEFHNTRVAPLRGDYPADPARWSGIEALLQDPFNRTGTYSDSADPGMTQFVKNRPEFWGMYKTPGLRNVALTAPYAHQGQFPTLRKVIEFYSTFKGATRPDHHQEQVLRPLLLKPTEISDLTAFLESLTSNPPSPQLLHPPRESEVSSGT